MKLIFTIVAYLCFTNLFAQREIKIYAEETKKGDFILYGDNNEPGDVSIKFNYLILENLSPSDKENKIFLIPAKASKKVHHNS